jgi:hypothetical protein
VRCGQQIVPQTAPRPVPTIIALKQADDRNETEMEKDVRAFLVQKVAEGFDNEGQIIKQAIALFVHGEAQCPSYLAFRAGGEYHERDVQPLAAGMVATLLEMQRRLESEWDQPTDCDRLDQAFDQLNRQRIIARQNLPCCSTCALAEISGQMESRIMNGEAVRGYLFYHEQDTEQAARGELFLSYGSSAERAADVVQVGQEIVQELERVGLTAAWNQKADERIAVPLTWRKRRFSDLRGGRAVLRVPK